MSFEIKSGTCYILILGTYYYVISKLNVLRQKLTFN